MKGNVNFEMQVRDQEIEKKDREIAELKASGSTAMEALSKACAQLSRLTAALKDDERAEKVVENHPWASDWSVRRQAINDFRFDIMKEAGI